MLSREFDQLRDTGYIVFWVDGQPRPYDIFGGGSRPGAWYATTAGAAAAGLELPPVRFAP